ncbi:DUF1376 domain-containing protein [Xylella fastidiosa]|uniref:YdaU family protein n=3 Tax=Xylella fastidiosa TaxID=2371 RepID=UPI000408CA29|nr:DUF1376 domain-containing protein [Xylella fastidiosa]
MNYYRRNIDVYMRETKHLSPLEHGIYFLLLDHYYTTEKPIPADKAYRFACARTKKEKNAADLILNTFFSLQEDGWHNKRCDEDIAAHKEGDAGHAHKAGGRL